MPGGITFITLFHTKATCIPARAKPSAFHFPAHAHPRVPCQKGTCCKGFHGFSRFYPSEVLAKVDGSTPIHASTSELIGTTFYKEIENVKNYVGQSRANANLLSSVKEGFTPGTYLPRVAALPHQSWEKNCRPDMRSGLHCV